MWLSDVLILLSLSLTCAIKIETVFEIPQGKLKGYKTGTIYHNVTYYGFKGIPYSKPRVGLNKFEPPELPDNWDGVFDATEHGKECMQVNPFLKAITGSEDCLFLNVYTPDMNTHTCHPVMVWIHGGGFVFGSGNDNIYGPDFLIEQGVVVVTMNYRLGPLGFINTGDANAPGNVGMKDQVYALKWVRKNINYFGGCPHKVTIFGESSGAASVHYHLLSPMSRGLFDRAIQQSGAATDEWAYNYYPKTAAFTLGETIGISTSDPKILMNDLKTMNATIILDGHRRMHSEGFILDALLTWLPSVEPYVEGVENFLPDHPMTLLTSGNIADVPIIAGVNLDECALFLPDVLKYVEKNKTYIYAEMHNLLPNNLNITDVEESKAVAKEIYKFYFGEKEISSETSQELLDLLNDGTFFIQYHITTLVAGEHIKSPIYKYLFTHRSTIGNLKKFRNIGNVSSHTDDLEHLWYSRFFRNKPKPGSTNEHFVHLFTKMWANFAKDGDPTSDMDDIVNVQWEPMGKTNAILNINLESYMQTGFYQERMNFWVRMYNKVLGEFGELLTLYAPSVAPIIELNLFILICYSFFIYYLFERYM